MNLKRLDWFTLIVNDLYATFMVFSSSQKDKKGKDWTQIVTYWSDLFFYQFVKQWPYIAWRDYVYGMLLWNMLDVNQYNSE